jgi:recombinational DNA repair protein RecT
VFDNRTVHLLYKYYFLELLAEYTRMVDYDGALITETVPVEEDELVAATLHAETGVMEEVQILQIERTVVGKTIVELLFAYADIVDDERAAVDMNAATIKERVRRTKDKEKELIVEGFDNMTKDQREIEKFFKDHRMGDWNVGMQKGLRQYVGDTYDREREEMEQQLHKERQLSRRDFVSDMQREIFMDGDAEREAADIEAEENSLRSLPEDDDYGDADDGGALDYEDVNE